MSTVQSVNTWCVNQAAVVCSHGINRDAEIPVACKLSYFEKFVQPPGLISLCELRVILKSNVHVIVVMHALHLRKAIFEVCAKWQLSGSSAQSDNCKKETSHDVLHSFGRHLKHDLLIHAGFWETQPPDSPRPQIIAGLKFTGSIHATLCNGQ